MRHGENSGDVLDLLDLFLWTPRGAYGRNLIPPTASVLGNSLELGPTSNRHLLLRSLLIFSRKDKRMDGTSTEDDKKSSAVQNSIDRLDPYMPEEKERLDLRGCCAYFNTPIYELRRPSGNEVSARTNELLKSISTADRVFEELCEWGGITKPNTTQISRQYGLWMSRSLQFDLNLPMKTPRPECAELQVLFLCEDKPFIMLTLYEGAENEKDKAEMFTIVMAKLLTSSLLKFCYCDFVLLSCTIESSNFCNSSLQKEVQKQLSAIQPFYSGPQHLNKEALDHLRAGVEAVAGVTVIPALIENPDAKQRWLLLLKDDWRDVVSLFIEKLVNRDYAQPLFYQEKSKDKVHVAALETAKRLSFAQNHHVTIVTTVKEIRTLAENLKLWAKEVEEKDICLDVSEKKVTPTSGPAEEYIIYIDYPMWDTEYPSGLSLKKMEVFRFLLLGKTGTGRSTTGNTLLEEKGFECDASTPFRSVTRTCCLKNNTACGKEIAVMDSPGLFDTEENNSVIFSIIRDAATVQPGFDAILYTLKIGRFTRGDLAAYERLKAVFGDEATDYMIIVFTHGDELEGSKIEDALAAASQELKNILEECGSRCVVFDNTRPPQEKKRQVGELLGIVREMRRKNDSKPFKCPSYSQASNVDKISEKLE